MHKIKVDHGKARQVLETAVHAAKSTGDSVTCKHADEICAIIKGSHLTYKYILVTALLAKATDDRIDPRALQKSANLDGAYDARSLCHSVIVPNEKKLMDNALGGSNEPFVNNPARVPQIDLSNAVRRGKDEEILRLLYTVLVDIQNSKEAMDALQLAIATAIEQKLKATSELIEAIQIAKGGRHKIRDFLIKLIAKSCFGETCVLAAAGLFWLLAVSRNKKWDIIVHPVNESGKSSNQVGDIDVRLHGKLIYTAEVKDKVFTEKDLDHALNRVSRSGFHTMHFIEGPRGKMKFRESVDSQTIAQAAGVELYRVKLDCAVDTVTAFAPISVDLSTFADQLLRFAQDARVKVDTLARLKEVLNELS